MGMSGVACRDEEARGTGAAHNAHHLPREFGLYGE
jgi:hypothetical protein